MWHVWDDLVDAICVWLAAAAVLVWAPAVIVSRLAPMGDRPIALGPGLAASAALFLLIWLGVSKSPEWAGRSRVVRLLALALTSFLSWCLYLAILFGHYWEMPLGESLPVVVAFASAGSAVALAARWAVHTLRHRVLG